MWQFGFGFLIGGGLVFACFHYGSATLGLGRELLAKAKGDAAIAKAHIAKLL